MPNLLYGFDLDDFPTGKLPTFCHNEKYVT